MKTKPGDIVEVNKKLRIITSIEKNVSGRPIVLWTCQKDVGVCMLSIWEEWVKGFDSRKRRGQSSKYDYKF